MFVFQTDAGEIQETADDIYGSISDATSPNEAMYNALSDGEIQVTSFTIFTADGVFCIGKILAIMHSRMEIKTRNVILVVFVLLEIDQCNFHKIDKLSKWIKIK